MQRLCRFCVVLTRNERKTSFELGDIVKSSVGSADFLMWRSRASGTANVSSALFRPQETKLFYSGRAFGIGRKKMEVVPKSPSGQIDFSERTA